MANTKELAAQLDSMTLLWWWFEHIREDEPESPTCRLVREVIQERKNA
jgi:hypothetical protein